MLKEHNALEKAVIGLSTLAVIIFFLIDDQSIKQILSIFFSASLLLNMFSKTKRLWNKIGNSIKTIWVSCISFLLIAIILTVATHQIKWFLLTLVGVIVFSGSYNATYKKLSAVNTSR